MLTRKQNIAQAVVNEITISYREGKDINDKVSIKFDQDQCSVVLFGTGESSAWELMNEQLKIIYPDRRYESIEFESLRLLTNLSCSDLARLSGVSRQALSTMINGERKPSPKVMSAVKEYLKNNNNS